MHFPQRSQSNFQIICGVQIKKYHVKATTYRMAEDEKV